MENWNDKLTRLRKTVIGRIILLMGVVKIAYLIFTNYDAIPVLIGFGTGFIAGVSLIHSLLSECIEEYKKNNK